jgi:hypothetical protein
MGRLPFKGLQSHSGHFRTLTCPQSSTNGITGAGPPIVWLFRKGKSQLILNRPLLTLKSRRRINLYLTTAEILAKNLQSTLNLIRFLPAWLAGWERLHFDYRSNSKSCQASPKGQPCEITCCVAHRCVDCLLDYADHGGCGRKLPETQRIG